MAKKKKIKPAEVLPFDEVMAMDKKEMITYFKAHRHIMAEVYATEEINAVFCRMLDSLYTDDAEPDVNRRQAWVVNHKLIMAVIHEFMNDAAKMPTVVEIANQTKLSRVTVTKHLQHFEKDGYMDLHRQKWKLAAEDVLTRLYREVWAEWREPRDRQRAMDLFLRHAEKFIHPVKPAAEASTSNFIQINNVYITPATIKSLPEEKRRLIESIILESNVAEAIPVEVKENGHRPTG